MRIITDMVKYTTAEMPKWHPVSISGYHIREAGSTAAQELAFTLANGFAYVEAAIAAGQNVDEFGRRLSFFFNSHSDFFEEIGKFRAARRIWARWMKERYGATDERAMMCRFHTQTAGVSLTAQQPENNVARIIIEMLAVTLSKNARARAIQLPGWNEALGLPKPWDQQWSLRFQQILAYETDLLEYSDLFDGSPIIQEKVNQLKSEAYEEIDKIEGMGGTTVALENGYMKESLVSSLSQRSYDIETNKKEIIGVNCYKETEKSVSYTHLTLPTKA